MSRKNKNSSHQYQLTPHKFKRDLAKHGYKLECFVVIKEGRYKGTVCPLIDSSLTKKQFNIVQNPRDIQICFKNNNKRKVESITEAAKMFNWRNSRQICNHMYINDPLDKRRMFPGNKVGDNSQIIRQSFCKIRDRCSNKDNKINYDIYNKCIKDFANLLNERKKEKESKKEEESKEEKEEESKEEEEESKLKKNVKRIKNWIQLGIITKEKGDKMIDEQCNKLLE